MTDQEIANIELKISKMTPAEVEAETRSYQERLLNVGEKYHHNAKLITLIKQWDDYIDKQSKDAQLTPMQLRRSLQKDLLKLIRVSITNHNPSKQRILGEVVVAGNSVIGEVRKTVPYNCEAAESYHLPLIIVNTLRERKFNRRVTKTVKGRVITEVQRIPEFTITELPPLTETELKELARRQALAKGLEVDND